MLRRLQAYLVSGANFARRFPDFAIAMMMAVCLFSPAITSAQPPMIKDLGTIREGGAIDIPDGGTPPPYVVVQEGGYSGAMDISGDGSVVVGWTDEKRPSGWMQNPVKRNVNTVGFIWTKDGGMTGLGSLVDGIYHDHERLPPGSHAPAMAAQWLPRPHSMVRWWWDVQSNTLSETTQTVL